MPKLEVYTVELTRPDGVSVPEMVAYLREAIEIWGGQRHPEDPLFYPWKPMGTAPTIRIKRRYP